jgi:hypothetical protein
VKLSIKFHPLLFQASLAAGGVALMPFNYLQYGVSHGKGLITWGAMPWSTMTGAQYALYVPLVAAMLAFTVLHFGLTGYFLFRLAKWLGQAGSFTGFINVPQKNQNAGIFAVVASLAMTANVFWAPLGFFVPWISQHLQGWMLPSLLYFGILWVALLFLEVKALRTWFAKGVDRTQFNFIWLLDVFAFALVSLAGSGIVAISKNSGIQTVATVATMVTLAFGLVWLVYKLVYLISTHVKAAKLPDNPLLPAFFLVIPIACLFGLAAYRVVNYLRPQLTVDLPDSTALVVLSYGLTIVWGLATLFLIRDYFLTYFRKSDFAPPQWGLV